MTVYAYADVGRTGLGNMLFPWARAEVFRSRHGVGMLAPRWTQPKIGPLLRGERDLRYYMGLFRSAGYVRGVRRAWVLARGRRVAQEAAEAFMASEASRGGGTSVVVFKGWEGWFAGLEAHRELVSRRLHEMLSPRVRRMLEADDGVTATVERGEGRGGGVIAAHVRRGDKRTLPYGAAFAGDAGTTIADEWYIRAIESVRAALGEAMPVRVYSDAKEGQIDAILRLPGVTRSPDAPSIVDIVRMSRARVLLTTAGSSFSAWSFYLGAMPTVFYPGTRLDLIPGRPELAVESDLDGALNAEAARAVARAAGREKVGRTEGRG
ncbi:MAG: hypothetical protein JNM80_03710 [Phycisphaerae bacterium]|nr:hypothetical protein [Phycisphaerae bacterium]